MKKTIFIMAILAAFSISCNQGQKKDDTNKEVKMMHEDENEHSETMKSTAHLNNDWIKEISLDNGNKWQANLETTKGVDKMMSLVKSSDPKTMEDYHNLASKLNEEKNFVVKECTMKGPSHDNLHVFLYPLIEKIEALGKVSTTDEGSEITTSIKENLNAYNEYFQ